MPDMMSMSPQVQGFGETPPAEQADQMFKERFTQIAYSILSAKFSELVPEVVTLKLLDSDADKGNAIGAFILLRNEKPLYIPVIMTNGQLKPLDMFYYKDLNIFLPLSPQWIEEVGKMSLKSMGESASIPEEVPRDVNIRDLILPPATLTGRVGYAEDLSHGVKKMFKAAEDRTVAFHPRFLDVLRNSPKNVLDGMKLAFQQHPGMLEKFVANYGVKDIVSAFSDGYEKNAKAKKAPVKEGSVSVVSRDDSPSTIKEVFGKKAAAAFQRVLRDGFAIKDDRNGIRKIAMKVEHPQWLAEPGATPGWFRLYFVDGPADIYYVIPLRLRNQGSYPETANVQHGGNDHHQPFEYLVIHRDLKEAWTTTKIVGEKINDSDEYSDTKLFRLLHGNTQGDTPRSKSYGFFVHRTDRGAEATKPLTLEKIFDNAGIRKIITRCGKTFVIDQDPSRKRISPKVHDDYATSLIFLPKDIKWVELASGIDKSDADPSCTWSAAYQESRRHSVITDPKVLLRWLNVKLQDSGTPVNVKRAELDTWWVDNCSTPLSLPKALAKVANAYGVSIADAAGILTDAALNGRSYSFVFDKKASEKLLGGLLKQAQPPGQGQTAMQPPGGPQGMPPGGGMPQGGPPGGGMPQGGPQGMDPNMMGMAPPPQSPMSPTDLAISEVLQGLQHQNDLMMQQMQSQMEQQQQAMTMSQQSTEQLMGVLQHIQQRSSEIGGATGGFIPAGAEGSPAAAAGMLAPQPPPEEQPPPMPFMTQETMNPEMIAQQINPQMVDQAADLQDQGVFDTAAIAMLAASSALQDVVASYIPDMERCLDKMERTVLTMWMKEPELKKAIGDEAFISIEDKLRSVNKNLGEVILSLSHTALNVKSDVERMQQSSGVSSNVQ
jgi:hypothetical protein